MPPRPQCLRLTGICNVCSQVFPLTRNHWDSTRDMCIPCSDERSLLETRRHERQRLTICVPPFLKSCELCTDRFLRSEFLNSSGNILYACCRRCRKREHCTRCRGIKKRRLFAKPHSLDSFFKTCITCRHAEAARNVRQRMDADVLGVIFL